MMNEATTVMNEAITVIRTKDPSEAKQVRDKALAEENAVIIMLPYVLVECNRDRIIETFLRLAYEYTKLGSGDPLPIQLATDAGGKELITFGPAYLYGVTEAEFNAYLKSQGLLDPIKEVGAQ